MKYGRRSLPPKQNSFTEMGQSFFVSLYHSLCCRFFALRSTACNALKIYVARGFIIWWGVFGTRTKNKDPNAPLGGSLKYATKLLLGPRSVYQSDISIPSYYFNSLYIRFLEHAKSSADFISKNIVTKIFIRT